MQKCIVVYPDHLPMDKSEYAKPVKYLNDHLEDGWEVVSVSSNANYFLIIIDNGVE